MTGATGNYYCGLHEFEDMAFVIHLLRPQDLFLDIGANIGSYTLLAGGHCGANVIAVEPLPSTFANLVANVRQNKIEDGVQLKNLGVGDRDETLCFTAGLDTVNHVVGRDDQGVDTVEVPVMSMDKLLDGRIPLGIKIDVEGFESKVVAGGHDTLESDDVRAVLMELNGSGNRYGFDDDAIHATMSDFGFRPHIYEPFSRALTELPDRNRKSGNTLYLRDLPFIKERMRTAPAIELPWRSVAKPESSNR